MPSDPGSIFPPFALNTYGRLIAAQIYDHLADVGPGMNTIGDAGFRPQLADSWTWSEDSLSIAFHLNPRARWHDGRQVTARDVKFTVSLYRNPALGAPTAGALAGLDSVTSPGTLTAVYWFGKRSPTQFLTAAAHVSILPSHVLERIPVETLRESAPLVGSGRFRLARLDKGSSGELTADTGNYRGRANLDRVIWTTSAGSTSPVTKLFTGAADLFDALRPEDVREVARNPDLRIVALNGLDYAFLHFNLRDPVSNTRPHSLFGDRDLRRAIAMSVDRSQVVRSILDTLALVPVGPTVRAYPTTDSAVAQLPYDTTRARLLLDSLGWSLRDGRGIRVRDKRSLAFTVMVPSSSQNRIRAAVIIQAQLRKVGIRMDIDQMDNSTMMERWSARRFDTALATWNMGSTPEATMRIWGTTGIDRNGLNFGSYSNPVFDAAVDSALKANDPRVAREFFSRAYRTINEDAPAIWLYEPKTVIGLHKRVRPSDMRQGAWWFDLPNWSISPSERLPRDQSPVAR
jgi:peptide/nickel transport system substrate-binding protein